MLYLLTLLGVSSTATLIFVVIHRFVWLQDVVADLVDPRECVIDLNYYVPFEIAASGISCVLFLVRAKSLNLSPPTPYPLLLYI